MQAKFTLFEKDVSNEQNAPIEYIPIKSNREKLLQFGTKPLYWKNAPVSAYQHFWRQFIDGWQQVDSGFVASLGAEMKRKFNMDFESVDFVPKAYSYATANPEFRDFIQQWDLYKSVVKGINHKSLIKFDQVPKRTNGWLSFENAGKNYLLAMARTKELLKKYKGQEITAEIIEEVQKKCLENVIGINPYHYGYRSELKNGLYSLLIGYNATEKGVSEWLDLIHEQLIKGRTYLFRIAPNDCSLSYDPAKKTFSLKGYPDATTIYEYTWPAIQTLFLKFHNSGITRITDKAELDCFFKELSKYYEKLKECEDLYDKVLVTVRLIKNSLIEHPFFDGNSRVFGMLILPHLLEELGLGDMFFWRDPNVFAMHSDEECIAAIVEGIENAQKICEGQPCALLKNSSMEQIWHSLSMEEKTYFHQCLEAYPFEAPLPQNLKGHFLGQANLDFACFIENTGQLFKILSKLDEHETLNLLEKSQLDLRIFIKNNDQLALVLDKINEFQRLRFLDQSKLDFRKLIKNPEQLIKVLKKLPSNSDDQLIFIKQSGLDFKTFFHNENQLMDVLYELELDNQKLDFLKYAQLNLKDIIQNVDQLVNTLKWFTRISRIDFIEQSQLDLEVIIGRNCNNLMTILDQLPKNTHSHFLEKQCAWLNIKIVEEGVRPLSHKLSSCSSSFFQLESDSKAVTPNMVKLSV